ncbi:MAG: hypothetical protein QW351_09395 [Candidatus Caldarchaeum sp.]
MANKQQALRVKLKGYPLGLINLSGAKAFWFLKVPVKPHREFPDGKLCESKIVNREDRYIAM